MEENCEKKSVQKCFMCYGETGAKLFTLETLLKCNKSMTIRRENKLKYSDLCLPDSVNCTTGYHVHCYRNFNAINVKYRNGPTRSSSYTDDDTQNDEHNQELLNEDDSDISHLEDTNDESLDKEGVTCLFCDLVQKKRTGRFHYLIYTKDYEKMKIIKNYATQQDDIYILQKLQEVVTQNITLAYHRICSNKYRNDYNVAVKKNGKRTSWHLKRKHHENSYEKLCFFLQENVVEKKLCYFYSFLKNYFIECLNEEYNKTPDDFPNGFSADHIQSKLLKDNLFKNKIEFIIVNNKNIVAPYNISLENFNFKELQRQDVISEAAMYLRREITTKLTKNPLPEHLTTEDLIKGECDVPPVLQNFFTCLIAGTNYKRKQNTNFERKVKSLSEDVIYVVNNGRIKTSKHITLGMTLKSLTSSKIVIDILNSYGHCCSYTKLLELETEATFACSERNQICPSNIKKIPNLHTGLAYDNFDRFVETIDGKETLHDTVGIIFQDESDEICNIPTEVAVARNITQIQPLQNRKRRTFESIDFPLEQYTKKAAVQMVFKPLNYNLREVKPANYRKMKQLDLLWMISHALCVRTPMFVGFYAKLLEDKSKKQIISYLTPLNESPTADDVVLETLKQTQQVADECNETYAQVTYDLAIAKKALTIQQENPDRFKNIFIHLGGFHVMLAYFKAIGKFIDGSGLTNIMVESGLIASGSVSSYLTGKHFHRCKRLHPLIALAFEMMHFDYFLESNEDIKNFLLDESENIVTYLESFQNIKSISPELQDEKIIHLIEKYQEFRSITLAGHHGKTSQYYMIYADLVSYYLDFTRAIRTGDFTLYRYIIPKMTNLFFYFNQPNYSRWLVQYHDNLLSVNETHPNLIDNFEKGCFGIKRTDKTFSRQAIDLTLEQTINADAARSLTGISHFTNSISARQRWSRSHGIRTTIISHVLDKTGVKRKQDVTKDLRTSRIKKDMEHIQKFINGVKDRLNPLSDQLDKQFLYNLSTGQAVPDDVAEFLVTTEIKANGLREKFITECIQNPKRFYQPISRNVIQNFASLQKKKKITVSGKVQEVKMQRDLFGRLLAISLEEKIDIEKVMSYPITPIPLSLCHLDGSANKTDKSVLLKTLEGEVANHSEPSNIDLMIVDGFFFLHLLKNVPKTFGKISLQILRILCSKRIDIVFDRYPSPSIKDQEHNIRQNHGSNDQIISENLNFHAYSRNTNFLAQLRNKKFKEDFVKFLIKHWASDDAAKIIENKIINVNFDNCYHYVTSRGKVVRTENFDLSCNEHEEADTKIVHHVCKETKAKNIVIRCSDTDILIIMLGNMKFVHSAAKVWMQIGTGNNRRFLNVSDIYISLGDLLSMALPAFHAFTGCDFNPAFLGKGKKRPLNILRKSVEFQEGFVSIGSSDILRNRVSFRTTFETIEKFVCSIYNLNKINSVNEGRLAIFCSKYKAKTTKEALYKDIKSYNASSLPPCKSELDEHFLRTIYITQIWTHAYLKVPTDLQPIDYGWLIEENEYRYRWFKGEVLPPLINDVVIDPAIDNESDVEDDILLNESESGSDADEEFDESDED